MNQQPTTLIAGIDLSLKSNQVVMILSDGTKIGSERRITNDLPGACQLRDLLLKTAKEYGCSQIKVGMEATGLYWYHLHQFLLEDASLKEYDLQVATLNPKLIAKFKKALGFI